MITVQDNDDDESLMIMQYDHHHDSGYNIDNMMHDGTDDNMQDAGPEHDSQLIVADSSAYLP